MGLLASSAKTLKFSYCRLRRSGNFLTPQIEKGASPLKVLRHVEHDGIIAVLIKASDNFGGFYLRRINVLCAESTKYSEAPPDL